MRPVVFAGPSLADDPVLADARIAWKPPAAAGDVYGAARKGARLIGLIDGRFESEPAVWHKEILWAMNRGARVLGAASMGALRAAELAPFGMRGVGRIWRAFRDGTLEDDDEVAVVHAPAELGFAPLSVAMVDIRATIAVAHTAGVLSKAAEARIANAMKALYFKERTWDAVVAAAPRAERAAFARWLSANRVEQKRADARALVAAVRRLMARPLAPFQPKFTFQRTAHWDAFIANRTKGRP